MSYLERNAVELRVRVVGDILFLLMGRSGDYGKTWESFVGLIVCVIFIFFGVFLNF